VEVMRWVSMVAEVAYKPGLPCPICVNPIGGVLTPSLHLPYKFQNPEKKGSCQVSFDRIPRECLVINEP
jgi:hypothetical protein